MIFCADLRKIGGRKCESKRFNATSACTLSLRCYVCCVRCILSIGCGVRLCQVHSVVVQLCPDSQLAFQRQVRQTHWTHRIQCIIFTDEGQRYSITIYEIEIHNIIRNI